MDYLVTFHQDCPDWKRPSHEFAIVFAGNDVQELINTVYKFMHDHIYHHDRDESNHLITLFHDRQQQRNDIQVLIKDINMFEEHLRKYYESYYSDYYYEESGVVVIRKYENGKLVVIN